MEFLVFDLKTKTLTYKTTPNVPKPVKDDILIKVAYSGICGTDLHILEGDFPCKKNGPFTLGHEFVGTVQTIGPDVKTFKIGDRVAVDPNNGCNLCKCCHTGVYQHCRDGGIHNTIGIFKDGGWASHALVPETQVYLLPNDVELVHAALSEPLSCLAHGWDIVNPVKVGSNVLLSGAGIIGLLWASILHLHGLRKSVTMCEPQEKRREIFKKMNLDYNVKSPTELLESDSFDVAIDCSGSGPAMESAFRHLAPGGRLCVFGVASPKTKISIEPFEIYMKELKIMGVNINPFSFTHGIYLVQAMGEKYLSYEKLGIKTFKLSEYREALNALKQGDISKVVFKF